MTYGILQDQVTAHLCVEYFTIGHMVVLGATDPTAVVLEWGVIATWWVGLFFGLVAGLFARVGSGPPLGAADLLRPTLMLQGGVGLVAFVAGIVGHAAAQTGQVYLLDPLAGEVPQSKHVAFLTDLWAHDAAYAAGFVGLIILCLWIRRRRHAVAERNTLTVAHGALFLLRLFQVMGAGGLIIGVLYSVFAAALSSIPL